MPGSLRVKRALFLVIAVAAVASGAIACEVGGSDTATTPSSSSPGTTDPSAVTVSAADAAPIDPKLGFDNINHLIFVVQENRSFDHYFGTFPGANGIPRNPDGSFDVCVPDLAGQVLEARITTPASYDVGGPHNEWASDNDINGGAMDGFDPTRSSA